MINFLILQLCVSVIVSTHFEAVKMIQSLTTMRVVSVENCMLLPLLAKINRFYHIANRKTYLYRQQDY